ncbi:glycosyltransferase [soil metagenome]
MSASPRMVFHYPGPVPTASGAGSGVRVSRMLEGFRDLGLSVEVVDGYGRTRRAEMRRLAKAARRGDRFVALYSEFTTMPTALADPHHLPLHPRADQAFFRAMRSSGVPVGVFYRDVQWRFPEYRARVGMIKRTMATVAYRVELQALRRSVDRLFLPTERMAAWLPGWERDPRVSALPPGGVMRDLPATPSEGRLRLFYVGSVRPPVYDLGPLLDAIERVPSVDLTVCCPESERSLVVSRSGWGRQVEVVHERGDALIDRYRACDVSCNIFPEHPYRDFAMPVKLFESLGLGRPVLADDQGPVGSFLASSGGGWAVPLNELPTLLAELVAEPQRVSAAQAQARVIRVDHTWRARCETAIHLLVRTDDGRAP